MITTESTHEVTTAAGNVVRCESRQEGENIINIVTIDGTLYAQDSIKAQGGWTNAAVEAQTEAERVAEEIASGEIRQVDGNWQYVS